VHNPANLPLKVANIAVPHGMLAVQRFDAELGMMVDAEADVLCDVQEEELYPTTNVNNCQLYIKHEIESNGLGFITVRYDPEANLTVNTLKAADATTMAIESADLKLSYLPDYTAEGVYFSLLDKVSGESKTLGFDMRYWQSFQSNNAQSSGVYIFRPKNG